MTLPDPRSTTTRPGLRLVPTGYDDPVVRPLVEEVQQVYVERYGGRDDTPMAAGEFAPPYGHFVVGWLDGEAVAMGGWRLRVGADGRRLPGERPAEIKRMFVRAHLRGRGLSRVVLAELESSARAAGVDWLVLETGDRQPEAVSLYRSCGFVDVPAFGLYACEGGSVYLGKSLL
ncbi:MAG TPA: GNAT family N-acetyltransferase [Nocardioidaceae bacterium]|nr:GNAT family N-acetyltransferase [Nocardioidaceae bacterium]